MAIVVNIDGSKAGSEHAVSNLKSLVAEDLEKVNQAIIKHMESPVDMIPNLAGHLINSGGKRLRPMLTLASARMCGYEGETHVKLAACVEFIHTATLLHDDVIDESDLRRGSPTANTIWGNQASVLVGDFLFSRAFQLMVAADNMKVLDILSSASAIIAEGEVMQLITANNTATTEDAYLKVISAKTAALFEAACRVGAVIAGDQPDQEAALLSYGKNLGIAFQLVDDALDYSGAQAKLGKTVGDDFREGKVTLPIVLAYRRGSESERDFWKRTIEKGEQDDRDLEKAIALLEKHGALADTIERARHYGSMARDALAIFPDSDYAASLDGIVEFCVSRTY
ncbi:MAG: polyprenyl synthetase family protein [Alphaproteobacteria bacterium]|nr:MAG: polyprenyl synthetase family protein [Alphaproteobacteria bacterium]